MRAADQVDLTRLSHRTVRAAGHMTQSPETRRSVSSSYLLHFICAFNGMLTGCELSVSNSVLMVC